MRKNAIGIVSNLLVFSLLLIQAGNSWAVIDKFTPYAFTQVLYDSNVFRVSGDQEAINTLGTKNKDDTIGHIGAGVIADYKISRQHILLEALLDRANYDTFSDLDHTRIHGKLAWKWQVGNNWAGKLGSRYGKKLSSFNQFSTPVKDLKTERVTSLDGGYSFHPDWRLVGSVSQSKSSYQKRERLDRDAVSSLLELQYKNTLNTRIALRTKFTKNDLKNREDINGTLINNDNDETEISGAFYWESTSKSFLEARLGSTDVKFDQLDGRDFKTTTGRLTYSWVFSGKTNLDFSIWRETSTESDEITTTALTKGFSVIPTWEATSKIRVTGLISFEEDDFKADNDISNLSGNEQRKDDTWSYRIGVKWTPRRFINLSIGYKREERDSDLESSDFDDNQWDAKVTLTLP